MPKLHLVFLLFQLEYLHFFKRRLIPYTKIRKLLKCFFLLHFHSHQLLKNNGKSNQSITSHKVIKSQSGLGCKGHLKSV